ncbi:NTP transferase domain-containing protein [Gluconacetobacter sacchari]|uniref:nucleotidyltransferase family protein n=1 Tax=Gluconacetobacter sacchari TaxID=92759 RepID=UPI0039B3F90A
MTAAIAALVLAAGRSSRSAPRHKLLAADATGTPMVARTLRALCASTVERVVVVLGHRAADLRAAIDAHAPYARPIEVTIAADHAAGLSASLRAGLRAIGDPAPGGVLVCLGDMPTLNPLLVARLIARHRQDNPPATIPCHGGHHGHPVLWDRTMIPHLMALEGDRGGGALIRALGPRAAIVAADETIHEDFDTPDRLDRFAASSPAEGG